MQTLIWSELTGWRIAVQQFESQQENIHGSSNDNDSHKLKDRW